MATKSTKDSPHSDTQNTEAIILTKQITLLDCTVLIIGTVIGSGIFISPKAILDNTGSVGWSLIVWFMCGAFSCVGALCYAELASSIPESGGDYSYLRHSFGPWVSFLRVWTSLLAIRTGGIAVVIRVAAKSLLIAFGSNCGDNWTTTTLLSIVILACIFYVNCWSVSLSRRIQVIFTCAKTLGLVIIILTGLWMLARGNTSSFPEAFDTERVTWIRFPRAFYSGLFAYSGWQFLPQVTEEILNEGRNIPLSIIISLSAVTALYLLTNLAYFAVLTPYELLASDSVAVTLSQRALGPIWWLLPIFVALSCIGSVNGGIFSSARLYFVASREGHLPSILSMIHIGKRTPLSAAACTLPICIVMLMTDDVYALINYLSFSRWLAIAATVMTVPYYRWKYPSLQRPFKVPLILAILFAVCGVFMVVTSVLTAFYEFLFGFIITISGIPIYAVFVWWQNKPKWWTRFMEGTTTWMQKLFLVVPQEKVTYVKNF